MNRAPFAFVGAFTAGERDRMASGVFALPVGPVEVDIRILRCELGCHFRTGIPMPGATVTTGTGSRWRSSCRRDG